MRTINIIVLVAMSTACFAQSTINRPPLTISDSATTAPLKLTEKSAAPTTPASGHIYLDDGTTLGASFPFLRRYTGSTWETIGFPWDQDIWDLNDIDPNAKAVIKGSPTDANILGVKRILLLAGTGNTDSNDVNVPGDATVQGSLYTKTGPVYNIKAWGAVVGGATDNYAVLTTLIAAVPDHSTIFVPRGTWLCNGELSLLGKTGLRIMGEGDGEDSILQITVQARSLLNLTGASSIKLDHFSLYAANPAGDPNCILICGRSNAGSFGEHTFDCLWVNGYCDEALVYSVASENNLWRDCRFGLYGGGANKVFATGQTDFLSQGDMNGGSDLTNWFSNCRFGSNVTSDPNASVFYVLGAASTGDWVIRDSQWNCASGAVFRFVQDHDDAMGSTGFTIEGMRGEGTTDANQFIYIESDLAGSVCPIGRLTVRDCTWGMNPGYFLYGTDDITLSNSDFSNLKATSGAHYISVYSMEYSRFFLGNDIALTARNGTNGCFIAGGGSSQALSLGSNSANNLVFWNGQVRGVDFLGGIGVLAGSGETALDIHESDGTYAVDVNNNDFIRWSTAAGVLFPVIGVSSDDVTYIISAGNKAIKIKPGNSDANMVTISETGSVNIPAGSNFTINGVAVGDTNSVTATLDPNSMNASGDIETVPFPDVALGDTIDVEAPYDRQGIIIDAYVSEAGICKVVFYKPSAGAVDLASGTYTLYQRKH